ncbi:uncharacterized protein LOC125891993 isoform X1 [Epinephelus fuscoguttatus]|uniref:uncharacterized protein LOC125891993 isoform X1 n=1 Tax=Epinephelus fuscoguttatus TaxID=293821 RepID=UPI0020D12DC8|nr:uncharacterized protein LOC125891993 isoform X1 [Epinephelus fuscoguttatus]
MEQDHIDATVIDFMDDDALAGYIPTYGDRIAARRFCLENKGANENAKTSKKQSLLEKLKKKMGIDENDDKKSDNEETSAAKRKRIYAKKNKWAEKKTRRVELGWIHEGKQVRKRRGGGTRVLDLPKESRKADILQYAKDLFFPNGKNKFGRFETFSHDILDYQEEAVLDEDITIGDLYTVLKMGMLRFYLCTKSLTDEDDEEHDEEKSDENNDVQLGNTREEDEHLTQTVVILSPDLKEVDADAFSDTEVVFGPFLGDPTDSQLDDTLLHEPSQQFEDDETAVISITLPPTSTVGNPPDTESVGDTASTSAASYEVVSITIKLHRVNLLEEMISQFKDSTLLKHPLKYTYIDEKGACADGVSRDVYAAFWTEFMDQTAEGEDLRVPSLSPKWQEEEWKSIGRILLKGFQDHGYYPCRLAPVFTVALIFGENEVSDDMLFESLLLYISQSDRDLITTALKEDLVDEDRDELLDLMDRLDVTTLPTQGNLKGILLKVAHKQLIQKPRYAAEKMSLIAGHFLKEAFVSPQHVLQMYEDKKPSTRKLLKLLDASPTTQAESQSFRFLQQYIRGLDDAGLRRMLRFVTGSDVICVNRVEVLFTPLDGLARRPVAHTC